MFCLQLWITAECTLKMLSVDKMTEVGSMRCLLVLDMHKFSINSEPSVLIVFSPLVSVVHNWQKPDLGVGSCADFFISWVASWLWEGIPSAMCRLPRRGQWWGDTQRKPGLPPHGFSRLCLRAKRSPRPVPLGTCRPDRRRIQQHCKLSLFLSLYLLS